MLPTMTLQFSDITTLDTELNATPLLPQAATELDPGFASLLQFRLDSTQLPAAHGGEQLPPTGNGLPLTSSAPDVTTELDIDLSVDAAPGNALVPPAFLPPAAPLDPAPIAASAASASATLTGPETPLVLQEFHSLTDIGRKPAPPAGTSPTPAALLEQTPVEQASALSLRVPVRVGPTQLRPSSQVPQQTDSLIPLAGHDADVNATERPALAAANRTDQAARVYSQSEQGAVVEQVLTRDSGSQVPAASTTPHHGISQVSQSVLSGLTGPPQAATPQNQPTQTIPLSVSDPAWGDQVGERIVLMANNKLQSAEIRLTPAELGPLRVTVSVDDGKASVNFHAPHATTREAVEQALPRLREMFAESGITLNQTTVGEQGAQPNERDTQQASHSTDNPANPGNQEGDEPLPSPHSSKVSRGLVDTFA